MAVRGIYATISVSDLARSVEWYRKLMGSPPHDRPTDTLVQWRGGRANLQLWTDAANAGHSMSTIVFTDLDGDLGRMKAAGVAVGEVKDQGGVRIAKVSDPDGNVLTPTEGPAE
jgi:catechol 2,3-dioxygenase-like lactoylglutathione lyase family enzyme